jgi:hypothetical protein
MKHYFIIITLTVFWSFHTLAGVIHVPQDQASIQAGINTALNGDTVLVADGTYYENINFRGRAITVASHYIMDGDTNHIANTVIDGSQPSNPDSGSVVYFVSGEDTNSILSGFTITSGTGTPVTPTFLSSARGGGGILCLNSGARIMHNLIINNSVADPSAVEAHGGGICSSGDSSNFIIIEDNIIKQNTIDADSFTAGAGIRVGTNARIINNLILGNVNTAGNESYGGGIDVAHGSPPWGSIHVIGNTITNNQVVSSHGFGGQGGGLTIWWYSSVTVRNNTITHNKSGGPINCWGSGMLLGYVQGGRVEDNIISDNSAASGNLSGTVFLGNCSGLIVQRNRLKKNSAYWGGGIRIDEGQGNIIANNQLIENDASLGGGIWIWDSSPIIENNLIIGNEADFGGGIRILTSTADVNLESEYASRSFGATYGSAFKPLPKEHTPAANQAAFYTQVASEPQIINNTISGNFATASGGGIEAVNSQAVVINSILWGNSAPTGSEIYVSSGSIDVRYSDVEGGFDGIGNIEIEPVFADTVEYRLSGSSSCIGAGIDSIQIGGVWYHAPPTDIGGNPRPMPMGTMPDMGAWEDLVTGLSERYQSVPKIYLLNQNYPNPFNPKTAIEFSLPQSEFVTLKIYNILGEEVATLVSDRLNAGSYSYDWDARDLASGVYLYRLQAGDYVYVKKMILMK